MPRGMWAVLGALVAFAVVVLSVLAWAQLSGRAGSQRGLVIHTELDAPVTIELPGGQRATLGGDVREHTFVVKRDQFPSMVRAVRQDGSVVAEREYNYADLVDADFRLSIDENGFYRTQDYRDRVRPSASEEAR